jgi:hypothetical protein
VTLFAGSNVYAPGEPSGYTGHSGGQNVSLLGRYHLDQLRSPNVVIGLLGLGLVAILVHKYGGRRR